MKRWLRGLRAAWTSWRAKLPRDLKPSDFERGRSRLTYFTVVDDEVWLNVGNLWIGPGGQTVRAISGGEGEEFGGLIGQVADFLGGGGGGSFSAPGLPSFTPPDISIPANMVSGSGGGGGGLWDTISSFAKDWAGPIVKGGIGLAQIPLGIKAMQDASAARSTLNQSIKQAQQTAAPAAAGAAALIPAATSAELGGALPKPAEDDIAAKVNAYRQTQLQALVSQGMDPATARAQIEAAVGQYEAELRVWWTNQLMSGGAQLTSAALGGSGQAAGIAGRQQDTTAAALDSANQALFKLLGAA